MPSLSDAPFPVKATLYQHQKDAARFVLQLFGLTVAEADAGADSDDHREPAS